MSFFSALARLLQSRPSSTHDTEYIEERREQVTQERRREDDYMDRVEMDQDAYERELEILRAQAKAALHHRRD